MTPGADKPIMKVRLAQTFVKAGKATGIPFKMTPHVLLRASTISYLKQQEFQDTDFMKATGHASATMVCNSCLCIDDGRP